MEGRKYDVAVIGGGASGLIAAIRAGELGASVIICEKMGSIGKKILASGNGRCNLLNEVLDSSHYNFKSRKLVDSIFSRFGKEDIIRFFSVIGLEFFSEEGRVFPYTNQSASVLKVIAMRLNDLAITVKTGFRVAAIRRSRDEFIVDSFSSQKIMASSAIICAGGASYPALGSDGSGYKLAKNFGHNILEAVPVVVPLIVKDNMCHILQGQKIKARAASFINGRKIREVSGDVLFTKYGLSGTAILDISRDISIAFHRKRVKDISVYIDMAPAIDEKVLLKKITKRLESGHSGEDIIAGILPNKFGMALRDISRARSAFDIVRAIKNKHFKVIGTKGWAEADFTAGGVDIDEIDSSTLESKFQKGLFFAGEVVDVDGERGGYNLAWAWASGYVAGEEAAKCAG